MKKPHTPDIRALLRENINGMTVAELLAKLPKINRAETARKCLERMPDAYIDRWVKGGRGQYFAVWCVVVPPEHCPHPDDRYARTTWQSSGAST